MPLFCLSDVVLFCFDWNLLVLFGVKLFIFTTFQTNSKEALPLGVQNELSMNIVLQAQGWVGGHRLLFFM